MNTLMISDWISIITALGVVVSIIVSMTNLNDKSGKRVQEITEIRQDIKYIREKLDRMDDIPGRMIRAEESLRTAHKRIDKLEVMKGTAYDI